jgi:hypothetical protein
MAEDNLKTCICCREVKPKTAEYFHFRNKSKGWLSSWCKDCRVANRENSKETELARQRERRRKVIRYCRECRDVEMKPRQRLCAECKSQLKAKQKRIDKSVRKKRLKNAMPQWADKAAIKRFYKERPKGFHVDHIIPIKGKLVSGLHVLENLQYLPEKENMMKSNHYSLKHNGRR